VDLDNAVSLDVEIVPNYALFMFKRVKDGEVLYFEKFNDSELNIQNLLHIVTKYLIITFIIVIIMSRP